jgi:hypothetical protein
LFSPQQEFEDSVIDKLHTESGMNFSNYELFTLTHELKKYTDEKEKRDEIYNSLKQKLKEIKESSQDSKTINPDALKISLFGDKIKYQKISQDPFLPKNHYFNLYLQAVKSEEHLDNFYRTSNSYMKHLIKITSHKLDILKKTMSDRKLSKLYEKRNFLNNYTRFEEDKSKILQELLQTKSLRLERHNILKTIATIREEEFKNYQKQAEFLKGYEAFLKKKGYDPYNLNETQIKDLNTYQLSKEYEQNVKNIFIEEKEAEWVRFLQKGDLTTYKSVKQLNKIKEEMAKDKKELTIARVTPSGYDLPPIPNDEFLSQVELDLQLEDLRQLVSKESIEEVLNKEKENEEKVELRKNRENYEVMLRKFHDRQVKKIRKPLIRDLREASRLIVSGKEKNYH